MFKGIYTAIVTPFLEGKLDIECFKKLLKMQKDGKVSGVVISGTTGESPTLSLDEKNSLIEVASEFRDENFQIIVGTGTNNTQKVIDNTNFLSEDDVDAVLVVTPYYNKPTQEGLFQHFKTIHENTKLPIIVYNVPSRTGISIKLDTLIKLSNLERVVSIKEASGDMVFATEIKTALPNFSLLSGDDGTFFPFLAAGGEGAISVVSNIAPELMVKLYNSFKNGDIETGFKNHQIVVELTKALFIETNPIPVKTALAEMGYLSDQFRLPLTKMNELNRRLLRMALRRVGLI